MPAYYVVWHLKKPPVPHLLYKLRPEPSIFLGYQTRSPTFFNLFYCTCLIQNYLSILFLKKISLTKPIIFGKNLMLLKKLNIIETTKYHSFIQGSSVAQTPLG
jgi:hypothetical protein